MYCQNCGAKIPEDANFCHKCGKSITKDYYKILQVDPSAEAEVIAAAYKRLALKYHPDTNKDRNATLRMQEINEAYEVLHDPIKRAEYDRHREGESKFQSHQRTDNYRQKQEEYAEAQRRREKEERHRKEAEANKYRAETITRLKREILNLEKTLEEKTKWFSEKYGYPPKPAHISYRGIISTMEKELASYNGGLKALFQQKEGEELGNFVAEFKRLVATLQEKQLQFRRYE